MNQTTRKRSRTSAFLTCSIVAIGMIITSPIVSCGNPTALRAFVRPSLSVHKAKESWLSTSKELRIGEGRQGEASGGRREASTTPRKKGVARCLLEAPQRYGSQVRLALMSCLLY